MGRPVAIPRAVLGPPRGDDRLAVGAERQTGESRIQAGLADGPERGRVPEPRRRAVLQPVTKVLPSGLNATRDLALAVMRNRWSGRPARGSVPEPRRAVDSTR